MKTRDGKRTKVERFNRRRARIRRYWKRYFARVAAGEIDLWTGKPLVREGLLEAVLRNGVAIVMCQVSPSGVDQPNP